MTVAQAVSRLTQRGWTYLAEPDICWMDCSTPATVQREVRSRFGNLVRIVLCEYHALYLEAGRWGEDYGGAPLPPESRASTWPWQPLT